jgi:predicted cupin superfamily sugar epimerase
VSASRVAELIDALRLAPHPEGGFYREIFRSRTSVQPADGRPPRPALTTIYFLLPSGSSSRWHRVNSDEVWHLYEGGPLELRMSPPDLSAVTRTTLAAALTSNGPVCVVPSGWWQSATPLGDYALAGCTVGPGFDFADFTMIDDDPSAAEALGRLEGGRAVE